MTMLNIVQKDINIIYEFKMIIGTINILFDFNYNQLRCKYQSNNLLLKINYFKIFKNNYLLTIN